VEYVFSSLLMLAERDGFALKDRTVGIVGVGNVGGRLQKRLEALGIRTLLCDPPRKDNGDDGDFRSLDELVEQCDVLTFHTPLFKEGPYKSLHLADEALIRRLKAGTILINACRGPVVDNAALLKCLNEGQDLSVVLDVWEPEPDLNVELLNKVDVGTAHIAVIPSKAKRAVRRRSLKPTAPLSAIRSRWRWIPYSPRLNLAALPCTARSIRQR
jgi:erythronate-4-phosphate dehydrogenase